MISVKAIAHGGKKLVLVKTKSHDMEPRSFAYDRAWYVAHSDENDYEKAFDDAHYMINNKKNGAKYETSQSNI